MPLEAAFAISGSMASRSPPWTAPVARFRLPISQNTTLTTMKNASEPSVTDSKNTRDTPQ